MTSPSARLVACFAVLFAGCSSRWVPDLPDFSSWFNQENLVMVDEIVNQQYCNAPSQQTSVQVLPDAQAVKSWEAARGVSLTQTPLPAGPFAIVDLGQRSSGGYGIAVSRRAGLKQDVLVLKATTFAPGPDETTAQVITSPCALVRLPAVAFSSLRLIDQSGAVRASTAVPGR